MFLLLFSKCLLFCSVLPMFIMLYFYIRVIPSPEKPFHLDTLRFALQTITWIFYISVSYHVTIPADEDSYQLKCKDNLTVNIQNITVEGSDCRTQQCIVTEDIINMFKNKCRNTSSCQLDMIMAPSCIHDYSHFNLSYTCNCKYVNVGIVLLYTCIAHTIP